VWLTVVASCAAAALPGLWGHAGTTSPVPLAVASDWTHVVAAAVWVGGLAVLLLHTTRKPTDDTVDPVLRFSRLAGVVIWLVLASGVGNALLHIGALDQLTGTGYGRLVIAKSVLFVGIAALGWRNRSRAIPRLRRQVRDGEGTSAVRGVRQLAGAEVALMVVALGIAGGLASSIPAEAEAAGRVEFVAAALTGDASVNVTFDPARPGTNVMHVYVLGPDGRPRAVDDADIALTLDGREVPVDLILSGPGHYTALNQQIPDAGEYLMEVAVDLDGAIRRVTATVVIQ
jgi:copper transport protein